MCRAAQADGHNAPGLIDRTDPGEAALVEDVGVGYEDAVRQPVVAHELPDIIDRIEFGAFRGQRQQGHSGWDDERTGAMPSRLIEEQARPRRTSRPGARSSPLMRRPGCK
jgi:hypothetical protein